MWRVPRPVTGSKQRRKGTQVERVTARLMRATLVAVLLLMGTIVVAGRDVSAKSTETVALLVTALDCETTDGPSVDGNCVATVGLTVTVTATDGAQLGACTTEAGTIQNMDTGFCYVEVPTGEVIATADLATVTADYALVENPRTVVVRAPSSETPDYLPAASFISVRQDAPAPTPGPALPTTPAGSGTAPVTLPNTGVGPELGAQTTSWWFAAGSVALLIALAVLARRRPARVGRLNNLSS